MISATQLDKLYLLFFFSFAALLDNLESRLLSLVEQRLGSYSSVYTAQEKRFSSLLEEYDRMAQQKIDENAKKMLEKFEARTEEVIKKIPQYERERKEHQALMKQMQEELKAQQVVSYQPSIICYYDSNCTHILICSYFFRLLVSLKRP